MKSRGMSVVFALVLLGACSVPGRQAAHLGQVRWRWRPPPGASVGAPAADAAGSVVTYSHTVVVSLTPDGRVRWQANRLGVREEAPVLTPDLVILPADDGLVAFARTTGSVRWDASLGGDVRTPNPDDAASTPIVAGRTVLTCLSGGVLVALDLDTGAVRWRNQLAGRSDGPPATDGRMVVATWDPDRGDGAGIAGFDVVTGERQWATPLHAGAVSAAAVTRGRQPLAVAVDHDSAAKAFDVDTGRHVWTARLGAGGSPEVPPLPVAADRVLVADRLAGLTLLDGRGHRIWSARADAAAVFGGPVGPTPGGHYVLPLYNGRVFVAGSGYSSRTVDAPGGLANGVALAPDGTVLLSSAQGDNDQLVAYGPP